MPNFHIPHLRLRIPAFASVTGMLLFSCGPEPLEQPQPQKASLPQSLVQLDRTGVFGEPETLSLAQTELDSLCAAYPYLSPDSLAVLSPDTAWARNLRAGEGRYGEGQCEVCEDGFFGVAALSLSRRHAGLDARRTDLQSAMSEVNRAFQCLDGGGTHHMHMVVRIPLLTEHALAQGIRSGFKVAESVSKERLDSLILLERPGRIEDPDEPQSSEVNCLAKFQDRFPDDPWILEQTVKALDRF